MGDSIESVGEILDNKSANELKEAETRCEKCGSEGHPTEEHGKLGGRRANQGRPVGSQNKKTLETKIVAEEMRQRILKNMDKLINAQMSLGVGEQVLMVKVKERDDEGKVKRIYHEVVDDPEIIKQYLDYEEGYGLQVNSPHDEDHFYYLSVRPANNQAIDSLLNRAVGKAPDKIEIEGGFFSQPELVIKVVESKHESIDIGEDGQIVESTDTDAERSTRSSDQAS